MKKLLFIIFLIPVLSFAQSDAQNQTAIDSLKNETNPRNNNKYRLWRLFSELNSSKLNVDSAAFTLTTSGTSGAATYNVGTRTLNIPNYTPSFPSNASGFLKNNGSGTLSWSNPFNGLASLSIPYAQSSNPTSLSYDASLTFDYVFKSLYVPSLTLGVIQPSALTGNVDDYNYGTNGYLRLASTTSVNITGLNTIGVSIGKILIIHNWGSNNLVFINNSSSSLSANRFSFTTGANITLSGGHTMVLVYTGSSWIDLSVR